MSCWDIFVAFLDRWQTLIAGLTAVTAAIVALVPVYKQIALMRTQNHVMVRATIGEMILRLDGQKRAVTDILTKRLTDISSGLYYFEGSERGHKFDEWCGEQQNDFQSAERELKALFVQSHDIEKIEVRKTELEASLGALTGVLWDVFAPEYFDRDPEGCPWTAQEHTERVKRSNEAGDEVEGKVGAVSAAARRLYEALSEQRANLVRRLRLIDDSLLA